MFVLRDSKFGIGRDFVILVFFLFELFWGR